MLSFSHQRPEAYYWPLVLMGAMAGGCSNNADIAQDTSDAQETSNVAQDTSETAISRVVEAATPKEAAKARAALFNRASKERVLQLRTHSDHGIALRAAWESVRSTLPSGKSSTGLEPNRAALSEFVEFVETRLQVEPPAWWREKVLNARAYGRDSVHFPPRQGPPYQKTESGLWAFGDVSQITRKPGTVAMKIGAQNIEHKGLQESDTQPGGPMEFISAYVDGEKCFVAMHSTVGRPYSVSCFQSNELIWSARVWAAEGGSLRYVGMHHHFVEMKTKNELVYVFGECGNSAYIEGFRESNGENTFRFNTRY